MSEVKNIQLVNIRSHKKADFQFSSGMNAVVGPNGSGKTTILESLYTLMRGTSFRGSLSELGRYGSKGFKITAQFQNQTTTHKRSLTCLETETNVQKKWFIDSKSHARLPISQRLPVVLFEPDLARLITGSPERRRSYLDHIAGQLDVEVYNAQNRFERSLRQRNQLLKTMAKQQITKLPAELFIWNTQLARLSETIVKARLELLKTLQSEIDQHYKQLGGKDSVTLTYQSSVATDPTQYGSRLLQFLETAAPRDIVLGHTSFGPHRDDIEVLLADQPAGSRASRGEVRTVVIALKLLETDLLSRHFATQNVTPILLLDDVLSELDLIHQGQVLAGFKHFQVFITTTDAHALTPDTTTIALD